MSDLYKVKNVDRLDFTLNSAQVTNSIAEVKTPVKHGLNVVCTQLKAVGRRPRTIESYSYLFNDFTDKAGVKYVEDINVDVIYNYLDMLDVGLSTKLIRLKTIKAVLSRFYDNGWFDNRFWTNINITIDADVKEGATEADVATLLSLIDKSTFVGLRNAAAILLMYRTGVRISTLGKLRKGHVIIDSRELSLDGRVQKNRSALRLPLDRQLLGILTALMEESDKVRAHYGKTNDALFITERGNAIANNSGKNITGAISKALSNYARKYDLRNINAHALRRAYAKNLLDKGANIALISKALGHKNISTTTQYLHLDDQEVLDSLREFS